MAEKPHWLELYEAFLAETDQSKLRSSLDPLEVAIVTRGRGLNSSDADKERRALQTATDSLLEIKTSKLNFPPVSNVLTDRWRELYQAAVLELERANMRGRIGDARTEIIQRVEKLRTLPGLHCDEHKAIEDALSTLRFLEREEDRQDERDRRAALEKAASKLHSIGPKIEKLEQSSSSE